MTKLIRLAVACLMLAAAPAFAQTTAPSRPSAAAPVATPVSPPTATGSAPAKTPVLNSVPSPAAAVGKFDINTASETQLDGLPGVGPARAKAIVANRPYTDLNDLVSKKVLSQSVFDGAKSRMALANINTTSAADLTKTLPGIGDVRAKAIVSGRPYRSPQDLVTKGILTQGVFDQVKDLVVN